MFRNTAAARLQELARQARLVHAPRGTAIARRGEPSPGLAAVAYGLVKLALKGESEKVLRLVGPGETFAEAALFLDQPLPVDADALADSLIVVVPPAPLLELFDADRSFARGLLASMSQRMHELVTDFEATTQHGALERLAAYLESLAPPGEAPAALFLPATKTVVAARLSMTKETLSRLLHQLARDGLVSVSRREITLLDRTRLAAAARGGRDVAP
jgi:CRP/FNR family transcriptional regulator, dissimilatory nitrate respiration regulator